MALTLPHVKPQPPGAVPGTQTVSSAAVRERVPIRDNTRLLLTGIAVLVIALGALLALASRSTSVAPDFLTDFVLYALSATNLTILVALAFVLARNIVKLVVERRRALPFARFRSKLVAVLLGMTLIPAVLVLAVGSELIRNSVDRWFNAPMDEVLGSANAIAADYYQEQQALVSEHAVRLGRVLAPIELSLGNAAGVRDVVAGDVLQGRLDLVEVYRVTGGSGEAVSVERVLDVSAPALSADVARTASDRLAARAARERAAVRGIEQLPGGGELIRTAAPIRFSTEGTVRGIVIANEYLTGQFAERARRMTAAYEDYQQLRVLKQPLTGVYLSFFLMLTLMILVGATWMGLYLAKRITRPVQMLAAAANEIGAGHLDHRVTRETADEFGGLVDAFNRMANELSVSRSRLEQSSIELEKKHRDVEGRRRYVETILARIATGVLSVDQLGRIRTINRAAMRLLDVDDSVIGQPAAATFGVDGLKPLTPLLTGVSRAPQDVRPEEVTIVRGGREVHLTAMATPLWRDDGVTEGVVLVFDDVTPLIRAQKVAAWREVARRLAHEIKNPLTPIQLCAERLKRHFQAAPEPTRLLVDECTTTIVGEVASLKDLVDEFSQFARMPAPRAVPTDMAALLTDALGLYTGLFAQVRIRTQFADGVPRVTVDPEQIRRVFINLLDNAIEAMKRSGTIDVEMAYERENSLVRVAIADDGPGIPPAEREKLFLPYYSTKNRGSGLGLAIVRRIVAEHGGSISVTDNVPRGTRVAVELPA